MTKEQLVRYAEINTSEGRFKRARDQYQEALPQCNTQESAYVFGKLAELCDWLGDKNDSIRYYSAVLDIDANHQSAKHSRGTVKLTLGQYFEGWEDYSALYNIRPDKYMPQRFEWWDGSATSDGLVLFSDQGFGDAVQFVRYYEELRERCEKIAVLSHFLPLRMLGAVGTFDHVVNYEEVGSLKHLNEFKYLMPLSRSPSIINPNYGEMAPWDGYITPPSDLVEACRALTDKGEVKVGIAWKGKTSTPRDPIRSIPARVFKVLADLPRVRLYSLQNEVDGQMSNFGYVTAIGGESVITDFAPMMQGNDPLGHRWDFMSSAAVVANLDLVITCDSAVAHIAGAIGKEVWLALPYASEFRWLLGRDDTPWYKNTRLFRQKQYVEPREDGWTELFREIREELAKC